MGGNVVPCNIVRLGRVEYLKGLKLQHRLAAEVIEGHSPGWITFLEHPHTYTIGRKGSTKDLHLTGSQLDEIGARVYYAKRGGYVTYHGPGQLVGYMMLNLQCWGSNVRWFIGALEASLIDALSTFDIEAETVEGQPGVWKGEEKLAAIGLHISQGVTTHGFALNVNPNPDYFSHIVSCGLPDARTTSVSRLLERRVLVRDVIDPVIAALTNHLELDVTELSPKAMWTSISSTNRGP
ncbi:MAG: lipoyl(octanoyl) transferase [Candidatus Woykebacteria bacterium RBG_13_40_15]|uniref:Octanoyltransferase n=1 Tax=Candidatus Woykebacteria bacterium RBG_13_40_15 TaxID=1802593 RepID=A0A1G1W8W7_9BACT|nr:MAG: lipoyl(octanoyl) transferase [Candidatus Woykebacteria bacterium RBG_13_40_15]